MSTFTNRVAQALTLSGVPIDRVLADSFRIEEGPGGYLLRWDGALQLTPAQAASLVGPHTGDAGCPACTAPDPDGGVTIRYCAAVEPSPV